MISQKSMSTKTCDAKKTKYFQHCLKCLDNCRFIASVIIYYAAPTISNLKPASLLQINYGERNIKDEVDIHIERASKCLNVHIKILRKNTNSCLIIVYKKDMLNNVLKNIQIKNMLEEFNYKYLDSSEKLLEQLKNKFSKESIPHEIGLFLGYPPEDVEGFIKNSGQYSRALGYWKVYGNVDEAEKKFKLFKQTQKRASRMIVKGYNIEEIKEKLLIKRAG